MRTFVVVLSCLASGAFLLPVLAQSAFTLTPLSSFGPNGDGSLRPGDQFYVTTDFAQRGVAYNPKTGNIIFVDRAAGGGGSPDISGGIYVLNGVTGEDVGSLSVNGMGGGAFADLAVGVADDGVVYVGNLVTDGTTSPFKLYRWPSDSTLDDPVLVFSGDPGNGKPQRWGDTMDIRGAGADTQILLGTRPAGGNAGTYVAILTTLDGVNFTATTLSTDVTDGASGGGIAFGAGDTFWAKNLDVPLRQFRFDLATGLAQTMHSFGGDVLPASRNLEPLAVDVGKNLLGIVEMVSGVDRVRLYDISDLSKAPVLLDMKDFAVDFQNGTTTKGYLDFGGDRLYVHNMNNGLQNYSIVSAPLSSPTIVNHPASERVLAGRPVRLEVLAFPAATYQWQRNGIDIPDATAPVFSLSDPKATDSGIYRVVVSNAAGSVPSDEAILTVVEPAQIFHLTPIWATPPAADSYVTSTGGQNTPNERGFAYDPASDRVFVVQRGGSTSANYTIHVVDGTTGNKLHTLLTNGITTVVVSEVPGANGIGLVAIDVAEDGAIYACNASPNAAGGSSFSENKLFRVYRWANSSPETLPVQVFSGDPAQQTGNFRWGDVLEVRGGGLNTQIVLDNQNAAARFLAILTPTDATMSAFISRYFLQDTADPFGTSIGRSIEFGEGNTVWQKRKAAALIQSSFDFNANPNISPKLAAHTSFPASLGQVALDRSRNLLAGINYATSTSVPDTLDLYEVSDLSDPLLVGSYRFPVNHINNNNFIGRVLFAGDRVYALNGNNGMVAFRIVAGASSPPAILKQPESKRLVTGSSASLNVIVAEEARFQWQFNEKDLAGANSATYTIANAKLTDAGRYRVIVSNDAGSTISSNAVVTVLPAENFHQLAPLWKLAPLEREYLREDTDGQGRTPYYRTLGYHRARNQIYLITRSSAAGGLAVNVLNATTGEHLHELDVSTVFGGSIILVAIGVADDGAIYASNMDTSGTAAPAIYNLYRWENADPATVPELVFFGEPAALETPLRWGDTMAIRGSGMNTEILIDSNSGTLAAILKPTDATLATFTPISFPQSYGAGSIGRSLQFGTGNTFWQKRRNARLQLTSFDLAAKTSQAMASYENFPASLGPVAIDASRHLLAGINYSDARDQPDTLDLYEVSDLGNPVLLAKYPFPTNSRLNAHSIGQVLFAEDRVFAVNGNNGLMAFTIVEPVKPQLTIRLSVNEVIVSWPASAAGYALEQSTSLSPANWTAVAKTPEVVNGQNTVKEALTSQTQFFRLRKD